MKKYINPKDKIAILEDKYNSMEDGNYKKKQLYFKIEELKRKWTPQVFWNSKDKGTYNKKNELRKQHISAKTNTI